ncbi:MAG: nucleotide exchange factor GrpE [Clostridia bacterium]|nr:nucleotide exchange factor GrpE [Clostridia bacterium]
MEKEYENAENLNEEINDSEDPVVVLCDDEDEDLKGKLDAEKARADEYLLTAKRLQAEFDNYRKRTNETNKRVKEDGNAEVLMGLIPVLDSFAQAEKMIEDPKTLDGIAIIKRQIDDLLSRFNVKKIDALGCEFDPNFHNAIMQMDVKEEEKKNTVVEVYQEGYTLGGRVLRHSVVIVGK